jgi:hypothetical protein
LLSVLLRLSPVLLSPGYAVLDSFFVIVLLLYQFFLLVVIYSAKKKRSRESEEPENVLRVLRAQFLMHESVSMRRRVGARSK